MANNRANPPVAEVELQQRLLADLQQFAVPRHARWDPLGLMNVRQILKERLGWLGELEEHNFSPSGEAGMNLILARLRGLGVWGVRGGVTRPWDYRSAQRRSGRRYTCKQIGSYAQAQLLLRQGPIIIDMN